MFQADQILVRIPSSRLPDNARLILFSGRSVILDGTELPGPARAAALLAAVPVRTPDFRRIGFSGSQCFAAAELEPVLPDPLPGGLTAVPLRAAMAQSAADAREALCRAKKILSWLDLHRFCGRCRTELQDSETDSALFCPVCGARYFPQLAPAVIVAVTRNEGREILLAHNRNFEGNVHSLIAGFVEAGETVEQAVEREVLEETSIRVTNIRYLRSQPWPFPNSLMLAFRAEYLSGTAVPDGSELDSLGWFRPDALPPLPRQGSVAAAVIRDWCDSLRNPPFQCRTTLSQ